MKENYDIIIIGSGAGGATVADYLGSRYKDKNILILESGPYRDKEYFNQKEKDMTSMYYKRGAFLSSNLNIGVAAANTVGGSTAVYTGVSFRPPGCVSKKWREDYGLSFLTQDFIDSRLDEIEKDINVHELPEDWDNDNNKLFKKGLQELKIPAKRLRINVKGCQQQGFCNLGCTSGGKQSTLEVQIPKAVGNGVELIYNAEVLQFDKNSVQFNVRKAPSKTKPNNVEEGLHRLNAKVIVLAAGVLYSPTLLLKSSAELGINNDTIGRYVTLHPALNVNGVMDYEIQNYRGFPKTWYSDHFSDSLGYFLETSFYYPGITAKNIPGFGKWHYEVMQDYKKMMSILILSHDPAEAHNRIKLDKKGSTVLEYEVNPEVKKALVHALRKSAEIFFAAGCKYSMIPGSTKNPLYKYDLINLETLINDDSLVFEKTPLSSAHPQGGNRMSEVGPSVVDSTGKVNGTESIYIADASLFPTSVKVNPYETVMLMARHVAESIEENKFKS